MSYCKLIMIANLTRDPELRFTPSGSAVVNLGVASNRKWKSERGEDKEEVSFFDCVAFGKTAENIGKWFKKGSPIFIEGRIKQESWNDKATGQKRSKVVIVVESFQFIGGRDEKTAGGTTALAPRKVETVEGVEFPEDTTVPF